MNILSALSRSSPSIACGILIACSFMAFRVPALDEAKPSSRGELLPGFSQNSFGEQTVTFTNDHGVRVHINAPDPAVMASRKKALLVFYALPNGNTIEQTIGKKTRPGDDWHFNIQHIAAQTRFVRRQLGGEAVVVAYLENSLKSWPAWRKAHGNDAIPGILNSVQKRFAAWDTRVFLTSHSGGGSLIFGYLNAIENIPKSIERIAFLDSNYAYDTTQHKDKLVRWLKASPAHSLLVFAYHDSIALLNGKTFVSEAGGTWGRSRQMRQDLAGEFSFKNSKSGELETFSEPSGRIVFFLRENPEKKIWHTVQVELNGYIHALLCGTPKQNAGYEYLGARAYDSFVAAD